MLRFQIVEFDKEPWPIFDEEPEPRKWLLSDLLMDQTRYEEDSQMFLEEIAKAEAGEPSVVGNHGVWARLYPDKVILEQMLYGEEETDGTVPERTEITLQEARQLILDWLEAKKKWYAEREARGQGAS